MPGGNSLLQLPFPASASQSYNWDYLWIVVAAFPIAFIMAFAMGANDVANSFGTSVGAKVLTLRQACLLAVIFETLGAVLLGTGMLSWKEVVDLSVHRGNDRILLYGEISSLAGSAVLLFIATFLKIPVSGTQALVGATVGFSLVRKGGQGVYWIRLARIITSWFVSPLLAGGLSGAFFVIIRQYILAAEDPMERGLFSMPFFYGLTIFINLSSLLLDGQLMSGVVEKIPWWGSLCISSGIGLITGVSVYFFLVPWQRRKIKEVLRKVNDHHRNISGLISRVNSLSVEDMDHFIEYSESTRGHLAISDDPPSETVSLTMDNPFARRRSRSFGRGSRRLRGHARSSLRGISDVEREEFLASINAVDQVLPSIGEAGATSVSEDNSVDEAERANSGLAIRIESPDDDVIRGMRPDLDSFSENVLPSASLSPESDANPRSSICCRRVVCCKKTLQNPQPCPLPQDQPEIASIFSCLQIVTATFIAFAHGGNDVSNAVGPLANIWALFTNERFSDQDHIPIWLLCFGALGISAGLCLLGKMVIETIGTTLSPVLPSSGFCIGLGTASTVLVASKIGLPISTTHCIVGSVIIVGWLRCREDVNWKLFGKITLGWLFTLPLAGSFGAGVMAVLMYSI